MTGTLSIYCDASVRRGHKEEGGHAGGFLGAGWGAVFVDAAGKSLGETHGPLKSMNSVVAEMLAARRALECAVERGYLSPGMTVCIASDCTAVADYLNGHSRRRDLAELAAILMSFAAEHGLTLLAIHVKGHRQPTEDIHARHNGRADRLSRVASGSAPSDEELAAKREAHNERQRAEAMKVRREKAARYAAKTAEDYARAEEKRAAEGERWQRRIARARSLQGDSAW